MSSVEPSSTQMISNSSCERLCDTSDSMHGVKYSRVVHRDHDTHLEHAVDSFISRSFGHSAHSDHGNLRLQPALRPYAHQQVAPTALRASVYDSEYGSRAVVLSQAGAPLSWTNERAGTPLASEWGRQRLTSASLSERSEQCASTRTRFSSSSDEVAACDVRAAELQEEMAEQRFPFPSAPTKTAATGEHRSERSEQSTERDPRAASGAI